MTRNKSARDDEEKKCNNANILKIIIIDKNNN